MKPVGEFSCKEHGLALTEYLLLLGLVIGGVTFAVGTFSTSVSTAWRAWAGVYETVAAPADTRSGSNTLTDTRNGNSALPCQNGIDRGNAEVSRCGGR